MFKTIQKPSRFYTVQRGDTAGKIARMHHVKLNDLILANNLNRRATVYARQTLRIPQGRGIGSDCKNGSAASLKDAGGACGHGSSPILFWQQVSP